MFFKQNRICLAIGNLVIVVVGMAVFANPVLAKPPRLDNKLEAPKVGDSAPDFTISMLGGDEDETVTLSDLAGKKDVVLIFGSYT